MKLASYNDGSRDGQLVVVSRDLSMAHYATGVATRIQQVLDDWHFMSPALEEISIALNQGRLRHAFAFEPAKCMAPLPRSHHVSMGCAYLNHVKLLCEARGEPMPENLNNTPLMNTHSGQHLLAACDAIVVLSEKMGIDFEAGLAVITGDVAQGASALEALEGIRLVALSNGVNLRALTGSSLSQSKPFVSFSPVAITPDELGTAWQTGRLNLSLQSTWNGKRVGLCDAGVEMYFHFGQLIEHLCKTRGLGAGSIVGSGPVSSLDAKRGYSCIAEKRALELRQGGSEKLEFMQYGDTIRIEMKGLDGHSLFGAIDQTVTESRKT
jgi:fumarylacetoacetate (FAA) hydrolase